MAIQYRLDCLFMDVKTWLGDDYDPQLEERYKQDLEKILYARDGYGACRILEGLSWEVDLSLAIILDQYL